MQYIQVDTSSATPLYLQIADQIRTRVRKGTLAAGTPLPPVRQLATDLAINPNTVAKAYMLLEREGIIHTVRRRGTFVANAAEASAMKAIDRRLDEAIDRLAQDAASLGIDQRELLEAMLRRIHGEASPRKPTGGESK